MDYNLVGVGDDTRRMDGTVEEITPQMNTPAK